MSSAPQRTEGNTGSGALPHARAELQAPRASVVLATYNRLPTLLRLLKQLGEQTLPADQFEVIVVDDGSADPVGPHLEALRVPFALKLITQPNGGAARARHRGCVEARGEFLVILDDDMQLPANFLELHLSLHEPGVPTAVFGRYRNDPDIDKMPLFERWYARKWEYWSAEFAGGAQPSGTALCTGNVSMRRQDYLAVGGFDLSLDRSEDAELGLKLEAHGVRLVYSEEAYTLHGSDHTSLQTWIRRAYRYGICDMRIARKHPEFTHADPWRFWYTLPRMSRPVLWTALHLPRVTKPVALNLMRGALLADRAGAREAALKVCGLVYGMEYFRGLGEECGGPRGCRRARHDWLVRVLRARDESWPIPRKRAALLRAIADLRADHGWYEDRYSFRPVFDRSLARDLTEKVGLQIAAGVRLMGFFRDAKLPTMAKITSRMVRHLYGSDIHWDAAIDPAVMFVHGMGLAINDAARVGPRCVIAQNVTLGMGIDPETRAEGSPTLEANVRVGAGATLLGPITVGEGSKIMPGVVLTRSVPKNSIVEPAPPVVRPREPKAPGVAESVDAPALRGSAERNGEGGQGAGGA